MAITPASVVTEERGVMESPHGAPELLDELELDNEDEPDDEEEEEEEEVAVELVKVVELVLEVVARAAADVVALDTVEATEVLRPLDTLEPAVPPEEELEIIDPELPRESLEDVNMPEEPPLLVDDKALTPLALVAELPEELVKKELLATVLDGCPLLEPMEAFAETVVVDADPVDPLSPQTPSTPHV